MTFFQGDSGGPLVTMVEDTWYLVGVTSWGYSCGRAVAPPIFTRVANFVYLIEQLSQANLTSDSPDCECSHLHHGHRP